MKLTEIGKVESPYELTAHPPGTHRAESRIVIYEAFTEGLSGLDEWGEIQVIFGFPGRDEYALKCLTDCGEVKGVFATLSPMRPSPIGVTAVELLAIEGNVLRVRGLEAANHSPVYDVKPFVPALDAAVLESRRLEQLKRQPRSDFRQAICGNDIARCLVKTSELHGHFCPGSALGVMAAFYGLRQLEDGLAASDGLENLMAVVETNACFADGVQAVSGCSLGNNSLVYRDLSRHAVTFARRGRETGIRIRVRPDFRAHIEREVPGFFPLLEKVIKDRAGSEAEAAAFKELGREAAFALIRLPFEAVLIAETVRPDLPDYAPITERVTCAGCGEGIMSTKIRAGDDGRSLCLMCAGRRYYQVEGQGIVAKGR